MTSKQKVNLQSQIKQLLKQKQQLQQKQKTKQKSKQDVGEFYTQQRVVVEIEGEEIGNDWQTMKAFPESVEQELEERESYIQKLKENDQKDDFKNKWDLRTEDFSCGEDEMSGDLYMVEQVEQVNKQEQQAYLKNNNLTQIELELKLKRIQLTMNLHKLSIHDPQHSLKEVIEMERVYPRIQEIQGSLEGGSIQDDTRNRIEALRIQSMNGTSIVDTLQHSFQGFYCFALVNENIATSQRLPLYIKARGNINNNINNNNDNENNNENENSLLDYLKGMKIMDAYDKQNSGEVDCYDQLTLCHQDISYINKWLLFFNREKLDCNLEFNSHNLEEKMMNYSKEDQRKNEESVQIRLEREREEEEKRLEQEHQRQLDAAGLAQQNIIQDELTKLTNELGDLNDSMDQQSEYGSREISGMMNNISSMQGQVVDKGEQLKCLEKALQIRQEEENTQVISLLRDEEMHKMKNTITQTKQKMREVYQKRIEELKGELLKQQEHIQAQKGDYDQLMVNMIKGGLATGDSSKCILPQQDINIPNKVEAFISNACSELLENGQENALDLQGGLVDKVHQCTIKELFCEQCCHNQFGADQLVQQQSCQLDCQKQIDQVLMNKNTFTTDPSKIIDPLVQQQMIQQIDQQIQEKQRLLQNNRFKQIVYSTSRFKPINQHRQQLKHDQQLLHQL